MPNGGTTQSYVVANFGLAQVIGSEEHGWTLRFDAVNLFDKVYYDALYDNGGFAVPGTRRRAILTATTRF